MWLREEKRPGPLPDRFSNMVKEGIAISFDGIAGSYDCWYRTPLGRFADEVESALAFKLFRVRRGDLLLDGGCGTGNFSLKLARKGARVVGVDLAPGMLAQARRKAQREGLPATFLQGDLCRLDYPANHFDGVTCIAAFEFIPEPRHAFHELMRVLKPGGELLIGTINRESAWGDRYLEQAKEPGSIYRRARFISLPELTALDSGNLQGTGEALFIEPDTDPEKFADIEKQPDPGRRGGFIAALWRKPPPTTERPGRF
ncbi:MAG: class I SAM-dependent methyltransferase [Firmicutes bacterium]|nr:class I SAM-dependent methyltransferase [Bacillota bacterium]